MAHLHWKGIDINGVLHSGTMIAHSEQELSSHLLKNDIGLISCRAKKPFSLFQNVSLQDKIDFFKQLSLLLSSGIFLDQALLLVMHQCKKRIFKQIIQDTLLDIEHGVSLSNSLKKYPIVFDDISVAMVETGQESGKLAQALQHLYSYQEMLLDFKKKLKAVLLMPFITFVFFIAIALVIFIVIVPTFGSMISSSGQAASKNTHYMIMVSEFIRSRLCMAMGFFTIFLGFVSYYCALSNPMIRSCVQRFLLVLPCIGTALYDCTFAFFFQSLAILTETGIHIVPALTISQASIKNVTIAHKMKKLLLTVQQGGTVSHAAQETVLFSDHIIALLSVGQESGCLSFIFNQIASLYKEKINKFLATFATLIQPLLLIVLGLLITFLVFAVYVPLFNVSSIIV